MASKSKKTQVHLEEESLLLDLPWPQFFTLLDRRSDRRQCGADLLHRFLVSFPMHNLTDRQQLASPPATGWQAELKTAFRTMGALVDYLELPRDAGERVSSAIADFPLLVPRAFAERMTKGNRRDPLLLQVLPQAEESLEIPGFVADPNQEASAALTAGVLQKYKGRALLITTGACAVHCRYCFRREYPYSEAPKSLNAWKPALEQLAQSHDIDEVILSGGDPLMLVDSQLSGLITAIADLPHIRRLRIHTRLPIVLPSRVTSSLVEVLAELPITPVVVVHANHAREIDAAVEHALRQLSNRGVVLLNQAVLLKDINDTFAAQRDLCERLIECRVLPYYLHQLDRVRGASHHEVDRATGQAIIEKLRGDLAGYLVPRYVEEIPGAAGKVPLA